jgi:AcrR family transcriptional regulator
LSPRKTNLNAKTNYHHGDLRRVLLSASIELIREGGIEALSLREVAKRAAVSPGAPYHHFKSKRDLLAHLAAAGFERLEATLRDALATSVRTDAVGHLGAIGIAYIEFAQAYPTEFRLMFRPNLVQLADLPVDCRPASAFAILVETSAMVAAQLTAAVDSDSLVCAAWSLVHGAAELILDGPLTEAPGMLGVPLQQVGPRAVAAMVALLDAASDVRSTRKNSPRNNKRD